MFLAAALSITCLQATPGEDVDPRLSRLITLDGDHPWSLDIKNAPAWRRRAADLRRQILVAGGLWPLDEERPPVQAVVHGRIERDGYDIQRVFFETWDGFYLTGNLYLPTGVDGPGPAVLSPHGHRAGGRLSRRSDEDVEDQLASGAETSDAGARYYIQARCHQLARMGCIVFHYDMVGYGDSRQLDHRESFVDLDSVQYGINSFGFQTYNSIRALDFLLAVPGVDPGRVGVTGASGGGTQTFILGAVDARPTACFPAVMVSTNMQGGCVCENAPHLRVDTNNVEIAACFAPRPMAMSAANDWTLHVETLGMPQLRQVYGLLGSPKGIAVRTWPEFGHNYNRPAREMMYGWFNEHLSLGLDAPIREAPFTPVEPSELSVFDGAHPLPDSARDVVGIRRGMIERAKRRMEELLPSTPADMERFRQVVGGALEVLVHLPSGDLTVVSPVSSVATPDRPGRAYVMIDPRDGRPPVPVCVLNPQRASGRVCVAVSGSGSAVLLDPYTSMGAALERMVAQGTTCVVPTGLLGDPAARLPVDSSRHGTYVGYTHGYNRTLLAERVRDLLVIIEAFGAVGVAPGEAGVPPPETLLWGEGAAGPWVLIAAALATDVVDGVIADWTGSFASINDLAHPNLLPGALGYGGLDAFTGLIAPISVTLCGLNKAPTVAVTCYRSLGEEEALHALQAGSATAFPGF